MECKKCSVAIPSEYEYVLSKNVCPKCGAKLMADAAMKVYVDLKKRLNEVEFVMDKAIVCERIAMFMISNYEFAPLNSGKGESKTDEAVDVWKAQIAAVQEAEDLSPEEIRAQEAARAEEIAVAREMGMDLNEDEELIGGTKVDVDRVQRLKKLAVSNKTGPIVRRSDP